LYPKHYYKIAIICSCSW